MLQFFGFVMAIIVGLGLANLPMPDALSNHGPVSHRQCIPRPHPTPVGVSGGGPVGYVPNVQQITLAPAGPGK